MPLPQSTVARRKKRYHTLECKTEVLHQRRDIRELEGLSKEIDILRLKIDEVNNSTVSVEENSGTGEEKMRLVKELKEVKKQIQVLHDSFIEGVTIKSNLISKLDVLQKRVDILESKSIKGQLQATLDSLEEELCRTNSACASLEGDELYFTKFHSLTTLDDIGRMQKTMGSLDNEAIRIRSDIKRLKMEQKKGENVEKKILAFKDEVNEIKGATRIINLKGQIDRLHSEISTLRSVSVKKAAVVKSEKSQLNVAVDQMKELEAKLAARVNETFRILKLTGLEEVRNRSKLDAVYISILEIEIERKGNTESQVQARFTGDSKSKTLIPKLSTTIKSLSEELTNLRAENIKVLSELLDEDF